MQLMIEGGPRAGQALPLTSSDISIGRGTGNDVVLKEQGVSRHHASLQRRQQGWAVVDMASTNGTFVNGQRLRAQEARLLQAGDRVSIGSSVLVLDMAEPFSNGQEFADPVASPSSKPHPALLVLGVVCLIVVLVGIVFVLVTVLRPAEAPPTATAVDPGQHLMTALPLPTGFDDIVTAVAPLLPTGMNLPFLGGTPTPTP